MTQTPPPPTGINAAQEAASKYPAFAGFMAIPEIAALMAEGAQAGWSQDEFQLKLAATKWWKTTSDTARQWQAEKLFDPAKASQSTQYMNNQVAAEAQRLGVTLDLHQIAFITEGALAGGWDATQIQTAIAGNARMAADRPGDITSTQTQLQQIAANYGLPMARSTTFGWAKQIAMGQADNQGFTEYAKNQAKIAHPYWEKQLDQGVTVRQLADPYLQTAGRLLEVNPDNIDLTDHKWASAFTAPTKGGEQQPMSQLDWAKKLMTDPSYGWDKTQNAKDSAFQIADQIRSTFGAS